MSLLMDALRRAEEEKKRGAADGGSADGRPQEAPGGPAGRAPAAVTPASPVTPLALEPMTGADLTVEDGPDLDLTSEAPENGDLPPEAPAPPREAEPRPPEAEARRAASGAERAADPSVTMPSARAVRSTLDDYFDASRSMAAEAPTRRGPAAGGAADAGITRDDSASHPGITAHTVFTAGRRPRSRRVAATVVLALLTVVVVLLAGGLYYGLATPAPPQLPVASAPAGLPARPVTTPPSPDNAVASMAGIQDGEPAPAPIRMSERNTPPEPVSGPAAALAPALPPAGPVAAPAPASDGTDGVAEAGRPLFSGAPEAGREAPGDAPAAAPAPRRAAPAAAAGDAGGPEAGVGAGQLRISRSQQGPRIDADVKQAYAALRAGDDDRAETLYRQALARNPDNINARYGLAGLAMRASRFDAAYQHYRAIADADPGDGRATAALLALEGAGDEGESRLKRLAAAEPDNDFVQFSLGTFYARQQRWPYAQRAFFEALRLDGDNPDYAFNLAVSLDQMGKSKAALEYYRTALELADRRAARFDTAGVMNRVRAISQALVQTDSQAGP